MNSRLFLLSVLVVLGAGWGITVPFTIVAVSTGHQFFGLIAWQSLLGVASLGLLTWWQGKSLPLTWPYLRIYLIIGTLGTVLPDIIGYQIAVHLSGGVISILLSLTPMVALPFAWILRMEGFIPTRLVGVVCGIFAILLIVGPKASLPEAKDVFWVFVAMIASISYATESTYVAARGTLDLDPIQVLLGAFIAAAIFTIPAAIVTGQWFDITANFGIAEMALIAASLIHIAVYASYVWLVKKAGAVFASQTAYLVTIFGVVFSIVLLGEGYSGWIWAALLLMLAGLFLVQPRQP